MIFFFIKMDKSSSNIKRFVVNYLNTTIEITGVNSGNVSANLKCEEFSKIDAKICNDHCR